MKDELLKAEDANVILVDWAGGSLPLYTQATANTRLVGLEVAYLISYLVVSRSKLFCAICNYKFQNTKKTKD